MAPDADRRRKSPRFPFLIKKSVIRKVRPLPAALLITLLLFLCFRPTPHPTASP
ncbi:hypothetical protein HMPREF1548_01826 [Clostridium sp. KLE 1755]|nr:hypothetical protein HMPREF1548_01826 [Clostridium sp. KLE 1755]